MHASEPIEIWATCCTEQIYASSDGKFPKFGKLSKHDNILEIIAKQLQDELDKGQEMLEKQHVLENQHLNIPW